MYSRANIKSKARLATSTGDWHDHYGGRRTSSRPSSSKLFARGPTGEGHGRTSALDLLDSFQTLHHRQSRRRLTGSGTLSLLVWIATSGFSRPDAAESEEVGTAKRPKGYDKLAKEIAKTIKETIELEASGATESEIRKSGDPVKGMYRELLTKYDSDSRVNRDASYVSLTDAFLELGNFYRANGPKARLTKPVQESVLEKLRVVEDTLEQQ